MTEYAILAAAAFFAGMLNTVAGGGTVGAPVARALPAAAVRMIVIAVGTTMSAVFLWWAFA